MYNDATREVAKELNVPLVDLAREMPKSSRYYYDYIHFTEEGTQKVGEILANNLLKIL
jgi:lysophospholipase L1-like esterase